MIDWLDAAQPPFFPASHQALDDPNGLLAAGGRTSPLWLDQAYRQGIFPWNDPDEVRLWWTPAPRAVITAESFRVPRTVKKLINRAKNYTITLNQAFERVIQACAAPRAEESGTWIDDDIITSYQRMLRSGRALSIELWNPDGDLVGGCYGLLKGQVFFGESMFSRESNASKIAFGVTAPLLFEHGIQMIDCQMHTEHLAQFGAREISRAQFEAQLRQAIQERTQLKLPSALLVSASA